MPEQKSSKHRRVHRYGFFQWLRLGMRPTTSTIKRGVSICITQSVLMALTIPKSIKKFNGRPNFFNTSPPFYAIFIEKLLFGIASTYAFITIIKMKTVC